MAEELRPEFLQAATTLYKVAAHVFGSLDVEWWVAMTPGTARQRPLAGPQIELRVIEARATYPRGRAPHKWRLTIQDALIRNSDPEWIERFVIDKVREVRESVRGSAERVG